MLPHCLAFDELEDDMCCRFLDDFTQARIEMDACEMRSQALFRSFPADRMTMKNWNVFYDQIQAQMDFYPSEKQGFGLFSASLPTTRRSALSSIFVSSHKFADCLACQSLL